jgi:hypothetical protein
VGKSKEKKGKEKKREKKLDENERKEKKQSIYTQWGNHFLIR